MCSAAKQWLIALDAYIRNEDRTQVNNLSLHFRKVKRTNINEKNQTENCVVVFLKKINELDKPLPRMAKKKIEK